MSEPLRIALIAEGDTDLVVIEAALKATLKEREFILTQLQPEKTRPAMGGGWPGVFKWCREFAARGAPCLELDPTLPGFDLFLIHLDADVAGMKYADCGAAVVEAAEGLLSLPCEQPCPPPFSSVEPLRGRLCNWLGIPQVGARTVLCIPSKSSEAWLAAAVLPRDHKLLSGIECNPNVEARLASLPKETKILKKVMQYRARAPSITNEWARVVSLCEEAGRFSTAVIVALESTPVEFLREPAGAQEPRDLEENALAIDAVTAEAVAHLAPAEQVAADEVAETIAATTSIERLLEAAAAPPTVENASPAALLPPDDGAN